MGWGWGQVGQRAFWTSHLCFNWDLSLSLSISLSLSLKSINKKKILRFYLFIFRQGEGGRKREKYINAWLLLMCPLLGSWPATKARALTGNRTGDPLVCRLALNPLSHTSQGKKYTFLKKGKKMGRQRNHRIRY